MALWNAIVFLLLAWDSGVHAQLGQLTSANIQALLSGNNLLQTTNNLALDAATANALASANAATSTADQQRFLLEQQQEAAAAASFAMAQAAARQSAELARNQATAVRVLTEQMQQDAAQKAASEAARARVAAVQAVINAQSALKNAGEKVSKAEMTFRGQFPGQCTGPGMYYHDTASYYLCDHLQHHILRCPAGFNAGHINSYTLGHTYSANTFCNLPIAVKAAVVVNAAATAAIAGAELGAGHVGARGPLRGGPLGPRGQNGFVGRFGHDGPLHQGGPHRGDFRRGDFRQGGSHRGDFRQGGPHQGGPHQGSHRADPVMSAHAAVPHLHAAANGFPPRAMTVTTQSHSQTHNGVTHTVQKHVRTSSDGRSYGNAHVADHSLGGGGRGGKAGGGHRGDGGYRGQDDGPIMHYHYHYDKNRGTHGGGYEHVSRHGPSHGDHGNHGGYGGAHQGGAHHGAALHDNPHDGGEYYEGKFFPRGNGYGGGRFHGLLPRH